MSTKGTEQTQNDEPIAARQDEDNTKTSDNKEVEKGSGYGPPNAGSGETVPEQEASPDGQPNGAGAAKN
jgi:hypothetical protein